MWRRCAGANSRKYNAIGGNSSRVMWRPKNSAMNTMKRSASMLLRSGAWAQSPSPLCGKGPVRAASSTARASASVCFITRSLARQSIGR